MFRIDFSTLDNAELKALATQQLAGPLQPWEKNIWQFISSWLNPGYTHILIPTSGSTGTPKQIKHSKEALLNSAAMTRQALQLHPGDTALLCLPTNKIGGMMMLVRSIYNRMPLYCIEPNTTPLKNIPADVRIRFAAFTPMQFSGILSDATQKKTAESIDKVILGGEGISNQLMAAIAAMNNEVYATFGMTETISHIALKRLNGPTANRYFKTLPNIYLSTGKDSQLIINAPLLSSESIVTNDIVRIVSEDEFEWLGRIDNVINSGGVKISAEQVEEKLTSLIPLPFFITAMPDSRTGERVVLVIEAKSLTEQLLKQLISTFQSLEKLLRPKEIILTHPFIKTSNGKLNRKESLRNIMGSFAV